MQHTSSPPSHDLSGIIAATRAHLERLLPLLREETERLATRQVDGLDQLLAEKLELLQALEQCEQARRAFMKTAGLDVDPQAMNDYLAARADDALRGEWQQVRALLQQLQTINQSNGLVIQRGLDQVGRQLAILRGESASAANVYDTRGQTRSSAGGREISRA